MRGSYTVRITILVLLVLVTACATTGPQQRQSGDRNVLTLEQIQSSNELNGYDVVRALRPAWLRVRPTTFRNPDPVRVYIDGSRGSDLQELMRLSTDSIEEMRFYNALEAQARFGMNNTNGAIAVRTRRG